MGDLIIKEALAWEDYKAIEKMAGIIIPEVYSPYIAMSHCDFFIERFQTAEAIKKQIEDGFEYFIFVKNDQFAGYTGIQKKSSNTLLLSKLYLMKPFRGYKIGGAGLQLTYNKALQYGLSEIELFVNENNHNAIQFYRQNDFTIVELLTNTFENGYTVKDYKMKKTLV